MATSVQIVIDCADPASLGEFWATALGYVVQPPPPGYGSWPEFLADKGLPPDRWNMANAVVDPAGTGPRLFFQQVPEPKTVKNRVHLDLNVGGGHAVPTDERARRVDAEVHRLVAAGAGVVREQINEDFGERCVVLRDPEGNEFCVQ
ncbi:MAG: VOC family protein [Mycobacteriaceae bacterium]|nr:VOC family protein [Mycobacteriaceae bacterium]